MTRSRVRPTFGLQAYLATLIFLFTATVVAEGRDPKEVDRQLRALERLIA